MKTHDEQHIALLGVTNMSLKELATMSGLPLTDLEQLLEIGVLTPSQSEGTTWHFDSGYLLSIRVLSRLKHDFELEPNALALTLLFLEKIRQLESQLHTLHARVSEP